MRKIVKILLFFIALIAFIGVLNKYQDTIRPRLVPIVDSIATRLGLMSPPCTEPLVYAIGTFDGEFNISEEYFLNVLAEAEAIWEEPFGKELFIYKEGAKGKDMLTVNLVYDYRQQATSKLASLGIVVENNRASYDALKAQFNRMKSEFAKAERDYDVQAESFNARQKVYEEKVEYWNERGGAPKKEYEELQEEKSVLDREVDELQAMQVGLNDTVEKINAMVVVLNRLVSSLNISVEDYNTLGAARGETFTEGVYSFDGKERKIDIYEFSTRSKLVRVLAHELGHALGLEHVEDSKAIMYELNEGTNESLTEADLVELRTRCRIE